MKLSFTLKLYLLIFVGAALSACNTVPMQARMVEQQNLKAAQQGSPYRWHYQATPGGGSLIRRYVIDPVDNPERWKISFDSRAWELGFHAKAEGQAIREYVLKGQSVDSWSELVTSTWAYTKGVSAQQLHEKMLEGLSVGCDSFETTTIKKSPDERIFEWKHDACKGWPAQHEIRRIKLVDGHLATLSYAIKTKKIDNTARNEWVLRISQATINKVESGRLDEKPDLAWLENRNTYYNEIIQKYGYGADEVLTAEGTNVSYSYPETGNPGCRECGTVTFVFSKKTDKGLPLTGIAVSDNALNEAFTKGCKLLVAKKFADATPLIKEAASGHHPDAQHTLGLMHINGDGVEKNHAEAHKWFYRAAAAGHARAQYDLGAMYRNGEGVQKNSDAAKSLYTLSANNGYAMAAHELGRIYQLEGDKTNAEKWLKLAKMKGYIAPN